MPNILFVSSENDFASDIKDQLELYATDFNVFDQWSDDIIFDIAVVDDLPQKLVELQQKLRQTPIIFLSSTENDFGDSVTVVTKPFRLENFLDSVLSCANLFIHSHDGRLKIGCYLLDSAKKEIKNLNTNKIIKLTEREVMILNYMYKAYPKIISKSELLSEVWEYNPEATTHTVETHIYRLRQKVEGNSSNAIILTKDTGYKLNL